MPCKPAFPVYFWAIGIRPLPPGSCSSRQSNLTLPFSCRPPREPLQSFPHVNPDLADKWGLSLLSLSLGSTQVRVGAGSPEGKHGLETGSSPWTRCPADGVFSYNCLFGITARSQLQG